MASTYVARHVLSIDGQSRLPGELVPEAATWDRLQSSLTVGKVRPTDVPNDVYVAAVRKYCPALLDKLAAMHNLDLDDYPEEKAAPLQTRTPGAPEPEVDPTLVPAPGQPTPEQLEPGERTIVHPNVQEELKPQPVAKVTRAAEPAEPAAKVARVAKKAPAKRVAKKAPAKKAPAKRVAKKAPAKKAPAKKA